MARKRRKLPLGLVIAIAITVSMTTVATILMVSSYLTNRAALVSAADDYTVQMNITLEARVNAITERPEASLQWLSHDALARASTVDERIQRLPVMADLLDSSPLISAVYAGYEDGSFLLLRKMPPAPEQELLAPPAGSHYLLQQIDRSTPAGDPETEPNAFWQFYNRDRVLLEHRAMPDYRYDPRARDWHRLAGSANGTVVTLPYVFYTTREIGVTMARRADRGDTVLGLDATLADLSSQLQDLRLTPGTELAILDKDNTLLAHPDTGRLAVDTNGRSLLRLDPEVARNTPQLQPLAHAMNLPADQQSHRFLAGGRGWYGITGSLGGLPTDDFRYVVAIPEDELLATARAGVQRQLIVSLAVMPLLLLAGWWLGQRIARPINEMQRAVREFSRFNFHHKGRRTNSRIREVARLDDALSAMANTIRGFQTLALTMNRERSLDTMLQGVLEQLLRILGERSGGIYLFERDRDTLVRTAASQALSLPQELDGIEEQRTDSDLIRQIRVSLPGNAMVSILRDRYQNLTGALVVELEDSTGALGDDLIDFLTETSGAAAVAIETRQLIEAQRALLDGVIRLVADAIDAKSPYTSGHCERVPQLANQLVERAISSREGPFGNFTMTEAERYEFQIAAWLHDCGKITSPEYVVDKASKLETLYNRIHEIRTRFEVLHRDAEIACLQARLAGEPEASAVARMQQEQQQLQREFALVAECNLGSESVDDEAISTLKALGQRTWLRHFSNRAGLSQDEQRRMDHAPEKPLPVEEPLLADQPWHRVAWEGRRPPVHRDDPANHWGFDMKAPELRFNFGELHNLTVRRGTLTDEERFHINDHIVQTVRLLSSLPLPPTLRRVPRLAGTHHERVDGTGYPFRLTGEDMSIPEKIMAIADVFEALTASDRPYKTGKTLTETLDIMTRMCREGHLDPAVFRLFLRSDIWQRYGLDYLQPEQFDQVNVATLLNRLETGTHA